MILNNFSLLPQHDKWLVRTVENLFEFYIMEGIHPWRCAIFKSYPEFFSEIENSVLQYSTET